MPRCSFNRELIEYLSALYGEMDRQTEEFRKATGLHCLPGCGQCCESEVPEVTAIEMLPAAEELFSRGEALEWLERILRVGERGRCVLFQPDPTVRGNGRCRLYPFRPSLCRLFSFAAMKNREGQMELQTCRRQKEEMPLLVNRAQEAIGKGLAAPSFDSFFLKMVALEPGLRRHRVPINRALRIALERIGLNDQLKESESKISGDLILAGQRVSQLTFLAEPGFLSH